MESRKNTRVASVAALLAAAFTTAFPPQAAAQSKPDTIRFYGVLRDFESDHPDFGLDPSAAPSHYASNIQFFADGDFKPVFIGAGYEVASQWTDKNGDPIAPHLYNFGVYNAFPEGTGVYSTGSLSMGQATVIDSWDSSVGSYSKTRSSDALIGTQATSSGSFVMTNDAALEGSFMVGPTGDPSNVLVASKGSSVSGSGGNMAVAPDPMPVRVPDFGASVGDVDISTDTTISSRRFECDSFTLGNTRTLTIEGHVEIVCNGLLTIGEQGRIELADGATLRIYSLSDVQAVAQDAQVNANTMDPSRVTFFHVSSSPFIVSQGSVVYATIYAPDAPVLIGNAAEVFGRVMAESLTMEQGGQVHIDQSLATPRDACNVVINDSPGAYGGANAGAVTSDTTFRQWFRTVPNKNLSHVDSIELKNDGAGTYEYEASDFTIADGKLYGNEGMSHNRNFTMEIGAVAQYDLCQEQFFEFEGDGDAWVMVNDRLVLDLGGLGSGKRQVVDLDRLGLFDGEIYTLRFFYAQRTNSVSAFKIRTNINLLISEGVIPDSSGLFD